jgi:GNAT superfamily N-acetyltransferase
MTSTVRRLGVADWEQLRDVRLRALQDSPSAFLKRDGSTLGMICGIPAGEDERDPDAAMMVAMWADRAVRGSGVAVALTDELVAWAKESDYAETFHDDPRVLRLLTLDL